MELNPYEPSRQSTDSLPSWTRRRIIIFLVGCLVFVPVVTIAAAAIGLVAAVLIAGDERGYMQNEWIPAGTMTVSSVVAGFGSIVLVLALSRTYR